MLRNANKLFWWYIYQGTDEIIKVFGKQCTARIEEHYDNIAVVMLGTLDVTEEDEEYLKVCTITGAYLHNVYAGIDNLIILLTLTLHLNSMTSFFDMLFK
jgi:hypothetical protein